MDIPVCGLSYYHRSQGSCGSLGRPQKCVGDMLLHFQLDLIILEVLSVSTVENLKD